MGMSMKRIEQMLALADGVFEKIRTSLYTKLEVGNSFAAVQVAFQKKILVRKEYCPEKIKALALEFAASKAVDCTDSTTHKKALWERYDLLIDFYTYMEENLLPNKHFQVP
jgi:hypothetical protein